MSSISSKKKRAAKKVRAPTASLHGKFPNKKAGRARSKTPEDLAKQKHIYSIRAIFERAGFVALPGMSDVEFTFDGQATDLDDYFVYENVLILVEYTSSNSPSGHLKNKIPPFTKILSKRAEFVEFLRNQFPAAAPMICKQYHISEIKVQILYASLHELDESHQENIPGPIYMNYPAVQYFTAVTDAIRLSSRCELLDFLGISPGDIGHSGAVSTGSPSKTFDGSVLPEAHSNFADGYKIVTFHASAEALLRTSYVLRKDGWRDETNLYQRMIVKKKIESIRIYLKTMSRVFINNIIVTLPEDTKLLNSSGNTIDTRSLIKSEPVQIQLPDRPNSVCLIDGQHRVFAYHETSPDDPTLAMLRKRQNLLVTGIIYPEKTPHSEKEKFEAQLFLEINSTQTSPRPEIKQAVGMITAPFAQESIAARVLLGLAKKGPLSGHIQQNFFDQSKLKTASIVSYGLKPLVKTNGNDCLFAVWDYTEKQTLHSLKSEKVLELYIKHCVETINQTLSAFRANIDKDRWTSNKKIPRNVISTSVINGFLIVLRLLIERGHPLDFVSLSNRLQKFNSFDTSGFPSSQYNQMAAKIVAQFFSTVEGAA